MNSVTVIGGGLSGLSTALLLQQRGYSVCVLEQSTNLGGALTGFVRGGFRFDAGFHYAGGVEQDLHPILSELGLDTLPWHQLDADGFDRVFYGGKEYAIGASTPIDSSDRLLHQVLAGNAMTMHLIPGLPAWFFREVQQSFRQGAYRLRGGCGQLIDRLAEQLVAQGGEIRTEVCVENLMPYLENGIVVSSLHPAATMRLLPEGAVRPVFRKRLTNLPNTRGMFTVHIRLRENSIRYRNYNQYIYAGEPDLWNGGQTEGVMVHYYVPMSGEYASAIDLLQPMEWSSIESFSGNREKYHAFKQEKARQLIHLAETVVPNLQSAISDFWTSSPLTWQRYTLAPMGCAFGTLKSTALPDDGLISPRTPIENLYLTGQSLAVHGLKGTLFSAKQTVNAICMHS